MIRYHPTKIADVARKSAAGRCGLRSGDRLLAVNGHPLRDAIDLQVYSAEAELHVLFEREGHRQMCEVVRRYGEPLGLDLSEEIFDGRPRVCRNNCDFCFVTQMPSGLRTPLYVKDDDYRLSFLHGNYITLTNLDEADFARIKQQFLTPLYISVHATEPGVRVDLMRNPRAGAIMDQLERLVDMGIELHTQAVLAPGRNDGAHLDRTIADLAELYPGVRDLSVVPVGLTRWCQGELRVYTGTEAADVLEQLLGWQVRLREQLGVGFIYPSDEWFLLAGEPVPELDAYDDLLPAMVENGVGMVRRFLDGRPALTSALSELDARRQTWVTGVLFAPVLERFAETFTQRTGIEVEVVPVANHFFGETVTVAGLLTVEDILATLQEIDRGAALVLPAEIFRGPDGRSLDDRTPEDVKAAMGCPVYLLDREDLVGESRWSVVRF